MGLMAASASVGLHVEVPPTLTPVSLGDLRASLDAAPPASPLVLTGGAETFCRGLDLVSLRRCEAATLDAALRSYESVLRLLRTHARPTVALVEGFAAGGGLGLAAACDLVIAGERARFALPEGLLGLYPAMVLAVLEDRVLPAHARTLALRCESIDAREAAGIGLVDRVFEGDVPERDRVVRRELRRLSRARTRAARALKSHPPWVARFDATLQEARRATARALEEPEVRQFIDDYLAGEPAPWTEAP